MIIHCNKPFYLPDSVVCRNKAFFSVLDLSFPPSGTMALLPSIINHLNSRGKGNIEHVILKPIIVTSFMACKMCISYADQGGANETNRVCILSDLITGKR